MTTQEAIRAVIDTANAQVGYREGRNNQNKYAAELDPLNLTFGPKQGQPWCAEFVLWVFYKCFGAERALKLLCSPRPTGIPLCADGAAYFRRCGRWSNAPSLGAVVFFRIDGEIGHEGIVVGIDGERIRTVEGNCSDMVARRSYDFSDPQIEGYGWPQWSVVSAEASVPVKDTDHRYSPQEYQVPINLLEIGDYGPQVSNLQYLLRDHGFDPGEIDGVYGPKTAAALRSFQRAAAISPDGVWGGESFRAMWNYLRAQ